MQALLPFLRGAPRTVRRSGVTTGRIAGTRMARPAVSLRHHSIQQAADQLELSFHRSSPAVYVHEGARQLLERRLAQVTRCVVTVAINDNRHSMIHATRRAGLLRVRLHHMFLDASSDVVEALARFLLFRDREASALVGRYIDQNTARIRTLEPHRRSLHQQGEHHDLQAIFDDVNATYFDGEVDARISWGAESSSRRKRRSTIKLGSYTSQERLIRIHPRLDRPFVPRYFVSFVVYHEMLHHVMPATRMNGRRMLHPAAFRGREKTFRWYERAIAWEKAHLERLLR